jgi:hypothetical protein
MFVQLAFFGAALAIAKDHSAYERPNQQEAHAQSGGD